MNRSTNPDKDSNSTLQSDKEIDKFDVIDGIHKPLVEIIKPRKKINKQEIIVPQTQTEKILLE